MQEPTRIAVLEGVEGSGKSTVAAELEQLGWGRVHFKHEKEPDRLIEWMEEIARAAARSSDGRVVVDRMQVSARVYGELTRGVPDIDEFDAWVMDGWVTGRLGELFWLPSRGLVESRLLLDEKFGGMVNVERLAWAMLQECHAREMPFTKGGSGSSYWHAVTINDRLPVLPELGVVEDEGFGQRLRPLRWLVGYQHNLSKRAREHVRWHSSFSGGCAVHLYRAMKIAGLSLLTTHVSNAYADDGTLRDLRAKWVALGEPSIVALGALASEALTGLDLAHVRVDHPQYARRFRRYDVVGYARELRDAAIGIMTERETA